MILVLAFGVWWAVRPDHHGVFSSVVPPVRTKIVAPQYAADLPHPQGSQPTGLLVRAGRSTLRVPHASSGLWLDDGRFLLTRTQVVECEDTKVLECGLENALVLDPRHPTLVPVPALSGLSYLTLPGEGLHRVNVLTSEPTSDAPVDALYSYAPGLGSRVRLRLPKYDGKDRSMSRNTGNRVYSIGGWDYVSYSDNDGEDASESYGYLRHRAGSTSWSKALVGKRLVALWVSRDGRALLGLQQLHGAPCGGCSKAQQIVEINPGTGKIAATYGVPKGYDKSWRVAVVDKVGDRVLVRYVHRANVPENLGVWQFDGHWRLVPGSTGPYTWWQGPDDRIVVSTTVKDPDAENVEFTLTWVHGGKRTRLAGVVAAQDAPSGRGIPGSLVPPG